MSWGPTPAIPPPPPPARSGCAGPLLAVVGFTVLGVVLALVRAGSDPHSWHQFWLQMQIIGAAVALP